MAETLGTSSEFESSFVALLIEDVQRAMTRRSDRDDQANRRDLIRAAFAALEGAIWLFREHTLSIATEIGEITAEERAAFAEVAYHVTEQGKIVAQQRFVPLPAMLRLTIRLAARLSSGPHVAFSDDAWRQVKAAIAIRNRITHPKSIADIRIGDDDLNTALGAFFWLLDAMARTMESANAAMKAYVGEARSILEGLKNNDPGVLEEYRKAAGNLEAEE